MDGQDPLRTFNPPTDYALLCPACRNPLTHPWLDDGLVCRSCSASFPVHFGIPDLRIGGFAVADDEFDVDDDLRKAEELERTLSTMTYREWFFGGVDAEIQQRTDARQRCLGEAYFRSERQVFGVHGQSVLDKLDQFLEQREPEFYRRWTASARLALEAGCGGGQYEIGFAKRFERVYVTDLSYVSLVQARRIAIDLELTNVVIFASNAETLPIASGSMDFVHLNGVIEHVNDPERLVSESARVCSDDGVAFFLSPNKHTLYIEPHFRVFGFSFWPLPLRRWLARRYSGARSFAGTKLRSLRELDRWGRSYYARPYIYMLPRRLNGTARGGVVRWVVRTGLSLPGVGSVVDILLNRLLLPVMPYHIMVGLRPRRNASPSAQSGQ